MANERLALSFSDSLSVGDCLPTKLLISSEYPHITTSVFYQEWGADLRMLIFMVFFLIGTHFSSALVIKNKSPYPSDRLIVKLLLRFYDLSDAIGLF